MVIEDDENHSIEFLDTTIYNCGDKLITKWFHKPMASNRILNYYSKHPKNMVKNVAKAFIRRVFTLSHKKFHDENRNTIKEILIKNNFPPKTIENLIHQVWNSPNRNTGQNSSNQPSYPFINYTINDSNATLPLANSTMASAQLQENTKKKRYAGMTYIPGLSEQLSKQLRRHSPELVIAPRPPAKVSQLFSDMKQKLRPGQCSCVVYGIPCSNCKKWYLGETSWSLDNRCKLGHCKDLKYGKKTSKNKTALLHHTLETKHNFNFDGKKVMKKVRTKRLLKIHEANQIIINQHLALNFKSDAEHISPEFYNLIRKSTKRRNVNPKQQVNLSSLFNDNT